MKKFITLFIAVWMVTLAFAVSTRTVKLNSGFEMPVLGLGTWTLTRKICTKLVQKFTDDEEYLEKELTNALPRVQSLELEIEHMTGKLVNES